MTLFIVSTPIGNLSDISRRASEVLSDVDLILAEDTRHSKKLLNYLNIRKPMMALHDHNEDAVCAQILMLLQDKNLALISDAGTPLISDPGFKLVRYLKEHGVTIVPIPGVCALIAGLSVAGLPTDRFSFEGFLPSSEQKLINALQSLVFETRTMIFYESPKRIKKTLTGMCHIFGDSRLASIARELTKINEQVVSSNLAQLHKELSEGAIPQKGEFVLMVAGVSKPISPDEREIVRVLDILCNQMSRKDAVTCASLICKTNKNKVYNVAIRMNW